MAKDLTQCVERGENAPKEHYSSRKGKKSITYAIKTRLLYDMTHLQHQHAILCSNDLKYCYDCIVNSVESMEIQLLGMHVQPMKCMLGMLQDLEHHIRIPYDT